MEHIVVAEFGEEKLLDTLRCGGATRSDTDKAIVNDFSIRALEAHYSK